MAESVDFKTASSVYDFTVKASDGTEVKLDKYKGKVLLIGEIITFGLEIVFHLKSHRNFVKYYHTVCITIIQK